MPRPPGSPGRSPPAASGPLPPSRPCLGARRPLVAAGSGGRGFEPRPRRVGWSPPASRAPEGPARPYAGGSGKHANAKPVTHLTPTQKGRRDGASHPSCLLISEQAARRPLMGAGGCFCPASLVSSPAKKQSQWPQPPGIRFMAAVATIHRPPDLQAFTPVGKLLLAQ